MERDVGVIFQAFLSLDVLTRFRYIIIYLCVIKYALYYTLNIKRF